MMMLRSLLLLLSIPFFLAGCAGTPPLESSASAEQPVKKLATKDEIDETVALLDYYRRLAAMPVADQQREYRDAMAEFERNPGEMQRLRLALLLSLPQVPWHDDARALQLLGSVAETPAGQHLPRNDLALIAYKFIMERLREVRDEHRKGLDVQKRLQGQLAERQRQLLEEQRKAKDLQGKLDALRRIDRKVLQRSTGR